MTVAEQIAQSILSELEPEEIDLAAQSWEAAFELVRERDIPDDIAVALVAAELRVAARASAQLTESAA
jgi:hypothetical protein